MEVVKATEKWRAQRKPLFSHGSASAEQRTPSGHVSRRPTRDSHQAASPSCRPHSPPAAPPRSQGSPHGCLDTASTAAPRASTPGTSSLEASRMGCACPIRTHILPWGVTSPHTGAERWHPNPLNAGFRRKTTSAYSFILPTSLLDDITHTLLRYLIIALC